MLESIRHSRSAACSSRERLQIQGLPEREATGNGAYAYPFAAATTVDFDSFLARTPSPARPRHLSAATVPLDHHPNPLEDLTSFVAEQASALSPWQVSVGLIASANVACALCRGAMSVSGFQMAEQFDWSDGFTGIVQSGFFLGFTLSSLGGGYLAVRVRPEALLALTVAGTSLFTALTPLAAHLSTDAPMALPAVRTLTGVCEGFIYPSIQGLISARVPDKNKSQALGLCYSGAEMGNVLALSASPAIIQSFGWSSNFHLFSACGLLWLAAWKKLLDAEQETSSSSGAAQSVTVPSSADAAPSTLDEAASVSIPDMFSNKAYRAAVASHASYQLGNLMLLSWMPTYFCQEFGTDLCHSSAYSALPWLFSIVATNGAGLLADKISASGALSPLKTRKAMQMIASGGPAVCLMSLIMHSADGGETATQAMLTMTAMISMAQFKTGGYGPNFMELSPKHASILCGTSTSLASLFGTAGIMATGAILENLHSWPLVFGGAAAVHMASLGLFLRDASTEPQFKSGAINK